MVHVDNTDSSTTSSNHLVGLAAKHLTALRLSSPPFKSQGQTTQTLTVLFCSGRSQSLGYVVCLQG